jgi:hypothetical protein
MIDTDIVEDHIQGCEGGDKCQWTCPVPRAIESQIECPHCFGTGEVAGELLELRPGFDVIKYDDYYFIYEGHLDDPENSVTIGNSEAIRLALFILKQERIPL